MHDRMITDGIAAGAIRQRETCGERKRADMSDSGETEEHDDAANSDHRQNSVHIRTQREAPTTSTSTRQIDTLIPVCQFSRLSSSITLRTHGHVLIPDTERYNPVLSDDSSAAYPLTK